MALDINWKHLENETSRIGVYIVSIVIFICSYLLIALTVYHFFPDKLFLALLLGLGFACLVSSSLHIALEWEKVIILRLGKYHHTSGPGLFFTIPIIDCRVATVDQRLMATPFMAEQTLTADTVPINMDAVLFWMVWDPRKATVEVENYGQAVFWAAQTTMRDIIGRTTLAKLLEQREALDEELRIIIDHKTESWGISVISVEIRDIIIPEDLQNAMSKEAQAERERNARLILARAEKDLSHMFTEISGVYQQDDIALQLRAMNLVAESIKKTDSTIIIPSGLSSAFDRLFRTAEKDDLLQHLKQDLLKNPGPEDQGKQS